MKKKRKPLFTWFRIIIIGILISLLILIIFGIVYAPLSGRTNKYIQGLNNMAMKEEQCITDSDCLHAGVNNSYCYIGKCICINGWSGDTCEKPCMGVFHTNCSFDFDCSFNGNITGECYFGRCDCVPGYDGDTCNFERRVNGTCFNDITCNDGYCVFIPPDFTYGECYCPENTINWNCLII